MSPAMVEASSRPPTATEADADEDDLQDCEVRSRVRPLPMVATAERGGSVDQGTDDAALIAAMARGDRAALATLYDRYSSLMLALATRMLGDRRESEDLLHDVLLETWRQAADYDPARGTVRSWILLRLRSRAIDRKKSAGATRVRSLDAEPTREWSLTSSDDPTLAPDRARVLAALAALSIEQRQVLELGYFDGLSSTEIAERIGVPVGTVKSRVAAALGRLRSALLDPESKAGRSGGSP